MIKNNFTLAMVLCCCVGSVAQQYIIEQPSHYRSQVVYTVTMPMCNIDTRYDVTIAAAPLPCNDTNLQHRYFITYTSPDLPGKRAEHITFSDSLYRSNRQVLFYDITHTALLNRIAQQQNDTLTHINHNNDTIIEGTVCQAFTATRYCNENVACRTFYVIDATTRLPILFRRENNPDMPTCQTIEACYITNDTTHYDFDRWVEQHTSATYNNL